MIKWLADQQGVDPDYIMIALFGYLIPFVVGCLFGLFVVSVITP